MLADEEKKAASQDEAANQTEAKVEPKAEAEGAKPNKGEAKAEAGAGKRRDKGKKAKGSNGPQPLPPGYAPRLIARFREEIVPALRTEFSIPNVMQVPRVQKVVINIGLGEALTNAKALETAERDLSIITGQHPVTTKAKKSIAAFKIREGMTIGMMVTLRGPRMYEFLDRLINVALPRIRDFRGAPNHGFDGRGNYSMGFREQTVFPEIDFNEIDRLRGFQITIVSTAPNDEQGKSLLKRLGFAFAQEAEEALA